MKLIDLHVHSTASDGSLHPADLVYAAADSGLKTLAITDHDTIDGLDEAYIVAQRTDIEIIPGVEISVLNDFIDLHILGLYIDYTNLNLIRSLKYLQYIRLKRNNGIIKKMNKLGIKVTMEELKVLAGSHHIGRSHFAEFLLKNRIVYSFEEAFIRFLGIGALAYIDKYCFPSEVGIRIILEAGGVAILAHPGMLRITEFKLEQLIRSLMLVGLGGIETVYSKYDKYTCQLLNLLSYQLGLVISGGSDFHGISKPDIYLGVGKGNLKISSKILIGIKQRKKWQMGIYYNF